MSSIARRLAALAGVYDSDVRAWRDAVFANGGSVSSARLGIVAAFVAAEKASGAWTLTDDYLGFWAENSVQARTSLKQRRLATATNSPTFTADRGFTTNGTTSYIDTLFAPVTHAVSMTANSIHGEIYERTELGASNYAFGVSNTSSRALLIRPRTTTAMNASVNSANGSFTLVTNDSRGLSQVGRSGAATTDSYGAKNGVDLVRAITPASVGATLPVNNILIGAFSNAAVPSGFRPNFYGFAAWGAALSGAQRLARYNNVQAWATSVGAQV
jgi:hypothetical protein